MYCPCGSWRLYKCQAGIQAKWGDNAIPVNNRATMGSDWRDENIWFIKLRFICETRLFWICLRKRNVFVIVKWDARARNVDRMSRVNILKNLGSRWFWSVDMTLYEFATKSRRLMFALKIYSEKYCFTSGILIRIGFLVIHVLCVQI